MSFFLTGATGFVGSHLTRQLAQQGEDITVLLHRKGYTDHEQYQNVIKTVNVNLLDACELANVMTGHDVVVHLAYGSHGNLEEQYKITVDGTKSVLKAAIEAKVKRLIYISTISVYGEPPKDGLYTEDSPRYASMGLYASYKQEAELVILNAPPSETEVIVLQPGIIYGPGGGYWTKGILNTLNQKMFPLLDRGQGLANLIHVYDVVGVIIKAATVPGLNGQCFIITNDEKITWSMFLRAYEKIVAKRTLIHIPSLLMKRANRILKYGGYSKESRSFQKLVKIFLRLIQFPYIFKSLHFFETDKIDFFIAKPIYSNLKAKKILGFRPEVDFETGIQTIEEWFNTNDSTTAS